ncbi:Scr1 family TA system antitoxin-like transcriptional regulator [Streptomyces roseoverticillatus]|uniref:Scr1 family TA system antitoxin-like transcriptional regulator n=1 Tax=Streptomyces roseoverticillatus TaxID=66429 RepID=UPI0027E454DB|nr:Scr1 family TA system antitoxin-like transcriptional regulator [Streptomyces roseoverticillatus]
MSFKAEARMVRNYESLFIPGLLQTEDYALAVMRICDDSGDIDMNAFSSPAGI